MASRVLVPMDDSRTSERALEYALAHHPDAEITVFHVVGVPTKLMGEAVSLALEDDLDSAAESRARPIFDRAKEIAAEYDTEVATEYGIGQPARAIVRRAAAFDAIVMGSHGRHSEDVTRRYLVGDVAKKVFRRSPVTVTTVR